MTPDETAVIHQEFPAMRGSQKDMSKTDSDQVPLSVRAGSMAVAIIFLLAAMVAGYRNIGWTPVLIVGGSGAAAFVLWSVTYLRHPVSPEVVLPAFLLTVAALEIHMIEEYLTGFGPAMSRLFNISWSERSFLIIFAFIGPLLYALTALGLFRRLPLAGFLMCFIFVGPGLAEFTHFIFPALRPHVEPMVAMPVDAVVWHGQFMRNLPNFWVHVTGRYYFPGMYTAILPMIPGIYGIRKLIMATRRSDRSH
jgi:hypothetical protein